MYTSYLALEDTLATAHYSYIVHTKFSLLIHRNYFWAISRATQCGGPPPPPIHVS
jgi:hypothetical protein